MKCPLKEDIKYTADNGTTYEKGGCIEADCAGWHKAMGRCVIMTISADLDRIATHLDSITDNIPRKRII